ncbi:MAG TPA: hypothetical protein V6C91_11760 [Coleofasciculaceae cyanobacterium]
MKTKLIREYAFKMARVFGEKISHAKQQRQDRKYLRQLEAKRDFWETVVHLPSDSEHWEAITNYIHLMGDPKASQTQLRASYKSLEEALNLRTNVSK